MGQAAEQVRLTEQDYLSFERTSPIRHEYADGEIFAMSGGTFEHSALAANVIGELRNLLAPRGCHVLTSDMRVKIPTASRYVYPDGSVVCARPIFLDEQRDTLLNPCVVVEVLSDSSEAYDRGDKFAQYRAIPSLGEYVLVSQNEPQLEVFTRQPDGSWVLRIYGPGQQALLPSLGCSLDVDRVYGGLIGAGAVEAPQA
ncbi:MAG: Uma2 family endonuclease [Byssovorax sp.]